MDLICLHVLSPYKLSVMFVVKETALRELSVKAVIMLQESFLQASLSKIKQICMEHKDGLITPFAVHSK